MTDLDKVAQSNVEVILTCLTESPEDHAWAVNEERLLIEYGDERLASDLAAYDAQGGDMAYFAVFTVLRYARARWSGSWAASRRRWLR